MKTARHSQTLGSARARPGRSERGVAIIVVLVVVSIILLYLAASARALHLLGRELKLVEQQQIRRLVLAGHRPTALTTTNALTAFSATNAHGPYSSH
jgi:hypothetical protein